ncbi:MAG: hypothetical protein PUB54_06275 [Lachnospiraceae bacterium]|nr:hypothetical protein [Lachnospiraceae bacterium]
MFLNEAVTVTTALENVTTAATSCLSFIQSNVLLMTVFAGGIISTLAFKFIGKAKKAAR